MKHFLLHISIHFYIPFQAMPASEKRRIGKHPIRRQPFRYWAGLGKYQRESAPHGGIGERKY